MYIHITQTLEMKKKHILYLWLIIEEATINVKNA